MTTAPDTSAEYGIFSSDKLIIAKRDCTMLLDIGCTKTTCLVSYAVPFADEMSEDQNLPDHYAGIDVIGAAHMARRVPCASGMAELSDQHILQSVIAQAEVMSGHSFASLYVSVPGQHIIFRRYMVELALDGMAVDHGAIKACLTEGRRRAAAAGEIPLHIWPVRWSVDDNADLRDPRGIRGRILALEMTSVSCSAHILATFRDHLAGQYRRIAGFIAAPYASSLGMVLDEEWTLGALCLDIGSHYTNYVIMNEGRVVTMGAIPVGGDLVTRDIARAFSIPLSAAEALKRRHATAFLSPSGAGQCYEIPQIDGVDMSKVVNATDLHRVVVARLYEVADLVKAESDAQGINLSPVRRLVLAGGGSEIDGADRALGQYLGMTARITHPVGIRDMPDTLSGPAFATGYGMARYAASPPQGDIAPKGHIDKFLACIAGGQKARHVFTRNCAAKHRSGPKHRPEQGLAQGLKKTVSRSADTLIDRAGLGGVSAWLKTHF